MIEVRLEFATLAEAAAFFSNPIGAAEQVTLASDEPQKAKRGGKKKAEVDAPAPAAGGSAADPLAGVLAPQAPVMQAPQALVSNQPVPTPAASQASTTAAVELKDVIAAFTAVGKAKGRDAIAAVLATFSATALPDIPKERWADAIAACNRALA